MCNCLTICRLPDIETDGRWPRPEHSPACEDYKTEKFVCVSYGGQWCLMEPDEAKTFIAESGDEYKTEEIFLTRDQFEALPEFDGF